MALPIRLAILSSFRSNDLLNGVHRGLAERIESGIDLLDCPAGVRIFETGDVADALYLIAEGSVRISTSNQQGEDETVSFLNEGCFFGENALTSAGHRDTRATALENCILGKIGRAEWHRLMELAPREVSSNLCHEVAMRVTHSAEGGGRNRIESPTLFAS